MDLLIDLGLPGLVFLALCIWLLRKVVRAARTEGDLEANRLQGALAEELQAARARAAAVRAGAAATADAPSEPAPGPSRPALALAHPPDVPAPDAGPLAGADLRDASAEHLPAISALVAEREAQLRAQYPGAQGRRIQVLWVRSTGTHAAWCERRHAASPAARPRDALCVARLDRGEVVESWVFQEATASP